MPNNIHQDRILVLDFGSQYAQLIARRLREIGVYCELHPFDMSDDDIRKFNPKGIILSGGPETVTVEHTPRASSFLFESGHPILGICYGMQTMAEQLGGKVETTDRHREFGHAQLKVVHSTQLLKDIEDHTDSTGAACIDVWMSHGDRVCALPPGFKIMASSDSAIAAIANEEKHFYGVQFHPEVTHTQQGKRILEHFVKNICGCETLWTPSHIIEDAIEHVKKTVGKDHVLLGLSGGVDSSVAAVLLHRAIGDQLSCVFVDNGLLRHNEMEQIKSIFEQHLGLNIQYVQAQDKFLNALKGISDPEEKKKNDWENIY